MAITLFLNAIFQKFKSPAPSAWYALALEKKSRLIGPQGPELWPCKNSTRRTISFKFEPSGMIASIHVQTLITLAWNEIFQKFKSLASSAWCALALGTRSRTIAALGSKLWSCKEGMPLKGFLIHLCSIAHNSDLE